MSKFTAGKWIADDAGEYVFTQTPEGLEMVAQMRGWSYLTKHLTPDEAIKAQKANARLIAAAPEMYGELYEALQLCKGKSSYDGDEFSQQAESIRELLARIDGKEEITAHEGTD